MTSCLDAELDVEVRPCLAIIKETDRRVEAYFVWSIPVRNVLSAMYVFCNTLLYMYNQCWHDSQRAWLYLLLFLIHFNWIIFTPYFTHFLGYNLRILQTIWGMHKIQIQATKFVLGNPSMDCPSMYSLYNKSTSVHSNNKQMIQKVWLYAWKEPLNSNSDKEISKSTIRVPTNV